MILALLFTFFQTADTVKTNHSHTSGIDSVQTIQTLSFPNNQFADSSRNFYNVFDITDIQSKISGGLSYQAYGIGIPSSQIQNGLLPKYQSFILNGFEWSDPVSGSLHPATSLTSILSSVKNQKGISGGKTENWILGYDFQAYKNAQTVIHYLDGYEKHSSFEGVFTTQITNEWSARAAVGRKTFEGFGQRKKQRPPEQTGTSDQWEFFAQAKRTMSDSLSTLNFMFMSSKHSYGNYGGINDTLTAGGKLSRTDFRITPMMYSNSTAKKTSSLFQIWYDTQLKISRFDLSNKTTLTTSDLSSVLDFPVSSFDSTAYSNKYESSVLGINTQSKLIYENSESRSILLGFDAGAEKQSVKNSDYIQSQSGINVFVSGNASLKIEKYLIDAGIRLKKNSFFATESKLFVSTETGYRSDKFSMTFGAEGSRTESALPLNDVFKLMIGSNSRTEKITSLKLFTMLELDNSWYKVSINSAVVNSPSPSFTNGRVLNDSLLSFQSFGKNSEYKDLNFQFINRWKIGKWLGDLESEGNYTFAFQNEFLPKHDIQLSLAHHDLWFDNAMNLWLGVEGHYRSFGKRIFPDARYGGLLIDLNRSSKMVKRVDLFARGQVSDMMFRFIWENCTNESNEYYDGYPEAISAIHFEITWWLWN